MQRTTANPAWNNVEASALAEDLILAPWGNRAERTLASCGNAIGSLVLQDEYRLGLPGKYRLARLLTSTQQVGNMYLVVEP